MKKLLLILALLAYVAISCEDKPQTLSGGDDPETEQVDTDADTCRIYVHHLDIREPMVVMTYKTSSDNVDFDASVYSIFQHFTITLKDGSYDSAIAHNCRFYNTSTFDSGTVASVSFKKSITNLKYGDYLMVIWSVRYGGTAWGPSHYSPEQCFFYKKITLDEQHTYEEICLDEKFNSLRKIAKPLSFTEF